MGERRRDEFKRNLVAIGNWISGTGYGARAFGYSR